MKGKERGVELMLKLGLNKAVDQLAVASSVRCYCHVLRGEDGRVLRGELESSTLSVLWRKGRLKRTWKTVMQVEEESGKVCMSRFDGLYEQSGVLEVG